MMKPYLMAALTTFNKEIIMNNDKLFWNRITAAILLTIFAYALVPALRAEDCAKQSWTHTSARTQGGGWIWFPGKFTAEDRFQAEVKALGLALSYESDECRIIPKGTKVHEKCVEKNADGTWTVYVRASFKDKICKRASVASRRVASQMRSLPFTRKLNAFKMASVERNIRPACANGNFKACYDSMNDYLQNDRYVEAAVYGQKACKLGSAHACGITAVLLKQIGLRREGLYWASLGCTKTYNNKYTCKIKSILGRMIKSDEARGIAVN